MRRSRADEPILITSAPADTDDGYDARRKKYAIMMSLRALCVIAAACTYQISLWLALAFVVGGMVLPWSAVIIANDRPARKRATRTPPGPVPGAERAIGAGEDRTVDG